VKFGIRISEFDQVCRTFYSHFTLLDLSFHIYKMKTIILPEVKICCLKPINEKENTSVSL
jgi:hypothetical protein